jgi:hypothetical protein
MLKLYVLEVENKTQLLYVLATSLSEAAADRVGVVAIRELDVPFEFTPSAIVQIRKMCQ